MLSAYFDLSETHDDKTGITSVAGYVALDTEWEKVGKEWQAALNYWNVGEKFHLSKLKLNPAIGHTNYDLCLGYFSNIIKNSKLHPIGAALYDDDWHQTDWGDITTNRLNSPYEQCLDLALTALGNFTNTHLRYQGKNLAIVCDPDKPDEVISKVFRTQQKKYPQFKSLTTESSHQVVPLQCADLGTGLLRQSWKEIFDGVVESELAFGSMPSGGMGQTSFWSLRGGYVISRAVQITQARDTAKKSRVNRGS